MGGFLTQASKTGDVRGALETFELTVSDFFFFRRHDPLFEAACVDLDLAIGSSIELTLRYEAAAGNIQATKVLAKGLGVIQRFAVENLVSGPAARTEIQRWALAQAIAAESAGRDPRDVQSVECPNCSQCLDVEINPGLKVGAPDFHDFGDHVIHSRYRDLEPFPGPPKSFPRFHPQNGEDLDE